MKRTEMVVLVKMTDKEPVYRTVMVDGNGHYWIRWNGKKINVDGNVEQRLYRIKTW